MEPNKLRKVDKRTEMVQYRLRVALSQAPEALSAREVHHALPDVHPNTIRRQLRRMADVSCTYRPPEGRGPIEAVYSLNPKGQP